MKPKKLSELDKKVPFTVPEGYFDELTLSIQNRIHKKPERAWLPQGQLRWALVAASLVILLTTVWVLTPNQEMSAEQLLAQVSEDDLIAYLDIQDISEDDLLEGVNTEIIDQLWTDDDALDDLEIDNIDIDDILFEYENDFNLPES
jgi:hypothetical protein